MARQGRRRIHAQKRAIHDRLFFSTTGRVYSSMRGGWKVTDLLVHAPLVHLVVGARDVIGKHGPRSGRLLLLVLFGRHRSRRPSPRHPRHPTRLGEEPTTPQQRQQWPHVLQRCHFLYRLKLKLPAGLRLRAGRGERERRAGNHTHGGTRRHG